MLPARQAVEAQSIYPSPPPTLLPGTFIWIPPESGLHWGIYLFKHGWFLQKRVSDFKVGGPMQTESGWSGKRSGQGWERENPFPFYVCRWECWRKCDLIHDPVISICERSDWGMCVQTLWDKLFLSCWKEYLEIIRQLFRDNTPVNLSWGLWWFRAPYRGTAGCRLDWFSLQPHLNNSGRFLKSWVQWWNGEPLS